jgi:hypothetical protein
VIDFGGVILQIHLWAVLSLAMLRFPFRSTKAAAKGQTTYKRQAKLMINKVMLHVGLELDRLVLAWVYQKDDC